jgi:capsular polysaccharide biosynthesis protein
VALVYFISPQYITKVSALIEQPRSTIPTRSRWEAEKVVPEYAQDDYIYNEAEKLKKGYFALRVIETLPDQVKEELSLKVGIGAQITEKLGKGVRTLLSNGTVWGDKGVLQKVAKSQRDSYNAKELLAEMYSRMYFNIDYGTSVINLSVKTFKKDTGQALLQRYMYVWMDRNLEENKREAKAIADFAMKQKDDAYKDFEEAEKAMVAFRKTYQMPADQQVARDIELQLELDRINSRLEMAKDRYNIMDQMYLESRMKEAGIVGNITILGPPISLSAPSRIEGKNILIGGVIIGLVFGIGMALLLDVIKGPVRYETDITETVELPVIGQIPRI